MALYNSIYEEKRGRLLDYDWRHKFTIAIDDRFGEDTSNLIYKKWNDIIDDAVGPLGSKNLTFLEKISIDAAADVMKTSVYFERASSLSQSSEEEDLSNDVMRMQEIFKASLEEVRDDIAMMYSAKHHAKSLIDTLEYYACDTFAPNKRPIPFDLLSVTQLDEPQTEEDFDYEVF